MEVVLDLPYSFPGGDPLSDLSPTARRILEAARRVLARDGFSGVTFDAVAAEANENKALIAYHFGNKAGLITALVDSVAHDANKALANEILRLPGGARRVRRLIDSHRIISSDVAAYRVFLDLVPHILRDEDLRPRLATLYRWYRDLDAWAMAPGDPAAPPELDDLCALTVAVTDGLALQHAADPGFDLRAAYRLWERLVRTFLEAGAAHAEGEPPPRRDGDDAHR
ncbi:MAG TPA: TetR/AcrR family transcriptional regulator [Thermoleophilia bacterium]|nr:TetR/AcrR family transcriptional regulator [Acidobacteriota bacterium]HQF51907.1 TetR/AcrR family transcriptional regulator [Thermoleophilia bacterium]